MGEMIKFGIKLAMTIAIGVAIVSAFLIIFNLGLSFISSIDSASSTTFGPLRDIFRIITLCLPFNFTVFASIIASFSAFKIAYWAQDKLIVLLDAAG